MKTLRPPSEMVYWMFETSGMMVRPNSKHPYLVFANILLHCTNLLNMGITCFISVLSDDVNFGGTLECAQHFVSNFHIATKHFNIVFRRKEAIQFFTYVDQLWTNATKETKFQKIFEESQKRSEKVIILMFTLYNGLIPLNILLWIAMNLYLIPDVKSLPMPLLVPFDAEKYFYLASFYQLFIFHSPLLSVGVSVSLIVVITEQVSSQIKVLHKMLESRPIDDGKSYIEIYKQHQQVIRLVGEMNSFFSGQYCFEMAMSSLQVAIRAYTCIWGIKTKNVMVVAFFLLIILTIVAPYVICSCGSIIQEESEKIHRLSYQNHWYFEKVDSKKDLLTLSLVSSKPLLLHYKYFSTFSMEQFTLLLQATYSYIAMIRHIDD